MKIEEQALKNQMAEFNEAQKNKYTVDGINFFPTQNELNEYIRSKKPQTAPPQREMSQKREHTVEVIDLIKRIDKRIEEGIEAANFDNDGSVLLRMQHREGEFCCDKHHRAFDGDIQTIVKADAVDYETFFLLVRKALTCSALYVVKFLCSWCMI